MFIWEGEELHTGQPLRAAYIGDARAVRFNAPLYLQHLIFRPDTVVSQPVKKFPMPLARQEAEKLARAADIVIVDANPLVLWKPKIGRSIRTPNWVRMEFVFEPGETWEQVQRRFRSHKNNVKRVQQNGFQYRISKDEKDFELFYDHMYVPLVQSRYGEYGAIDRKESMRAEFHKGFLLMIDDAEGRPVAAQLTYLYRKTMYSISSGILNGDSELHSKGALGAIYYYSIQWCYEHGMERFEMGGCRPFQMDGLYQYKQHWGMTPTPELWSGRDWLFWTPKDSPAAVSWMNANPVVSLEDYWHKKKPAPQAASSAGPNTSAGGKQPAIGKTAIPVTGEKSSKIRQGAEREKEREPSLVKEK